MSDLHVRQIENTRERVGDLPLAYLYDANDILVGWLDDTSESCIAEALSGITICDEEMVQEGDGQTDPYYRMAERCERLGYKVIAAEWWYKKLDPNYSIKELS